MKIKKLLIPGGKIDSLSKISNKARANLPNHQARQIIIMTSQENRLLESLLSYLFSASC